MRFEKNYSISRMVEKGAFGNAPYVRASEIATAGCASLAKSY
jgi:hypothetical protein